MSLPSSGPISFYDIQQLFGGTNPISFNEYFSDGLYITDNSIRSSSFQQSTPVVTITSLSPNASHIINTVETDSSYQYIAFQNNSSTSIITYDLDFSEETICDVLVVGGGGSGGVPNAGGGGAGGVVYINNISVKNAKIAVGKGGDGITTTTGFYTGNKGENSAFSYDNNNTARHINRFLPIENNEINVSVENNLYIFNDTKYQAYDFISLSIGVYYFKNVPTDNPIGFVIDDSLNFNVLSGTVFTGDTKTINGIDIIFYTGDIEIEINDDFGTISYLSYYNGYMGGYNRLKFKIDFNNYVTVSPNLSLHNTTNDKEYMIFTYDENNSVSGQTNYQLTLDRTVKCSILIVAGGGGGGASIGSGGGAGGLIFYENIIVDPGTHIIKVGNGGFGANNTNDRGDNGYNSEFNDYITYGGGGGTGQTYVYNRTGTSSGKGGYDGGSGGGGTRYKTGAGQGTLNQGNDGGSGPGTQWRGGGGGGAGEKGQNSSEGGKGGNGIANFGNIDFKTYFNLPTNNYVGEYIEIENKIYFAGGGGAHYEYVRTEDGGYGGGGGGSNINALSNTGGGGGGGGSSGGNGGSGVVIMRFEDMIEKIITYRFNQTLNDYPFIQSDNDNLVAWYKFDLGEELIDSKGNYPLTNDGSVTFSSDTKIIGKSSYFPNSDYDGYLNITGGFNPYNIWNGNGISFSVWYNLNHTGTDTYGRLFEFGSSNTSRFSITTKDNGSNVIALQLYNSSWLGNVAVGSGSLDDIWHHLVWSIDTSGVWTCYIDGINENINITASIPNMSFTLNRLGKSIYHDTDQQDLKGYLDDFRIYNKVLTENEVLLLYNQYNQTKYELTIADNVECDILIVAGGGGGGAGVSYGCGGGGGAGGVIYKTNETLYGGTYDIFVGKGGIGMTYTYSSMENYNNGSDSGIYDSSENIIYLTKGGGAGGARKTNGASGGSGGGGGGGSNSTPGTGGASVNTGLYSNTIGFNGGDGNRYNKGGGGGGAGGIGETATGTDTSAGNGYNEGIAGKGGAPIIIDITGENKAYAGGGGGGSWQVEPGEGGSVVIDGQIVKVGGDGGWGATGPVAGHGTIDTGSGGGGARHNASAGTPLQNAGDGSSGIIIICVKDKYKISNTVNQNTSNTFTEQIITYTYDESLISYPIIDADSTNLMAWYKFDGDFNDSSGNNNHLVVGGGTPTFSSTYYVIGQSANFLDGNNWLKTNSFSFDGGNWCFALWVKIDSSNTDGNDRMIFFQTPNADWLYGGLSQYTDGRYELGLLKNTAYYGTAGYYNNIITTQYYTQDIGNWVHLVAQQRADGILELYRNGVNIGTGTDTTITSDFAGTSFDLGYFLRGSRDLFGIMDDFRYYNRVLSSTEIQDLYDQYYQTKYELTLTDNVLCDVLVVGGGSTGDPSIGDGGGGGGVVYDTDIVITNNIIINVGKGGTTKYLNSVHPHSRSWNGVYSLEEFTGKPSYIKSTSGTYLSKAMGARNIRNEGLGRDGSRIGNPSGGTRIGNIGTVLNGIGSNFSKGGDGYISAYGTTSENGENGPQVNITGTNTYYAAGGGGGAYKHNSNYGSGGSGGLGGGGNGTHYGSGSDGAPNTGSGGGGGGNNAGVHSWVGGNGGSGIVILKIKEPVQYIGKTLEKEYFNYTGTHIIWNIPNGVDQITVYIWGGGGGGMGYGSRNKTSYGGGGGFVKATLNVGNINSLIFVVGGGGSGSTTTGSYRYGGFLDGGDSTSTNYHLAGSGGGLSGIFNNDANFIITDGQLNINAQSFIIAGGGGGAGDNGQDDNSNGGGGGGGGAGISFANGRKGQDRKQNNNFLPNTGGDDGTYSTFKFSAGDGAYAGGSGSGYYGGVDDTDDENIGLPGGGGGSSYWGGTGVTYIGDIGGTHNTNIQQDYSSLISFQIDENIGIGASSIETSTNIQGGNGLIIIEYYKSVYIPKYNGFVAQGGGGGGKWYSNNNNVDGDGGSGGGGGGGNNFPGGVSTQFTTYNYGLGNNGGSGSTTYAGGGGGGATFKGNDSYSTDYGADGGDGIDMSFLFGYNIGDNGWFGGGGGGGGTQYYGLGGKGGGGTAGNTITDLSQNGMKNTGGGGGADRSYGKSGNGGSGVVIVRYKSYVEYYYKQKRESESNYISENLNTNSLYTNFVDIDFYNGKTHGGTLQKAKGLLLYPGTYRVSYYKGFQPSNGSDQSTLYKCESNGSGGWIMNYESIPLVRAIGAQGNLLGEYIEEITIPDIDDYYFTLNETSAVMLHTTGIKSWIDKYGNYNNSKELELWDKYFKSQYNNLPFPGNDSTYSYYSWQDISYHDIKIIKYGDNKPSVSLNQFFNLQSSIPLPFTDYLLAHYKCESTSFVFSGTTITQWNDSSQNTNNITNYRGTPIQRTFTKGTKGTTGSGLFNTVYGDFNSGFKLPFTLDSNFTFCYVARYVGDKTNTTYNKRIFDSSSGIGENTWWGFNNNKTGVSYNYKNNYYTTQHKQHSEPDYWMIGIETQNKARFNGQECTNYYEYLDNFYPLRNNDYNANLTINYGFKTGGSGDNSEASNWEIAEMIFYNKELSEYEMKSIEEYLANKFSHISFSNVVTNLDSFKTIVTSSNYVNDLTDMWFYVYDGYKYSYNNVSGLFTGPVSFRFDLFKYDIGYPVVQTAVNDLFAWYKFDKDFTDSSGNGNDLIVGGGIPTFSLTDFVIGQSANFLNGNNWLKTYSFNFDGGNWCFALWVKIDHSNTSADDRRILYQTPNTSSHWGGLEQYTDGKYSFYLYKASNYNNQVVTSQSYSSDVGTWVHLAVKQEIDGIIKIYRNGINVATGTDTTITSDFSGYSMDFGYFARATRDLFGLMDDFRWYQRSLTDNEILDLYTQYSTNQYNSKYYWIALVSNNNTNKNTDSYDNRNSNNIKCNIEFANCTDDYFVHMVSLGGGGGGGKSKEDDTYRFSGSGGGGGLAYVSNKHIKNKIISIEAGSKGIGGTNILENSSGGDTTISWDDDNLVIGNGGYQGYDYGSNNLALGGAYSGGDGGDYGGNSIYEEDKMHRLGGKISNILKNVILQQGCNLYDIINHNFIYWMSYNFVLGNDSSIYYGSGGIGARRNTYYDSTHVLASNGGPGCAIVIIDFNDINTERTSISIQKELKHKDYLINLVSYEARAIAIEFTRALGGTSRSNYSGSYGGYIAGNWNSTIIWIPVPKNYNCVVASGDNFTYATNIQIVRNATIDYTLTNGYTGGSAVYSNDVYGWRTHIYNNLKEGDIIKWYEGGSVIKKPYAIFLNIEQYVYNSNNDNGFGQTEYTLTFNEDTVCNVLIVAGGGGGGACQGYNPGGGGGAGEVLEKQVTFLASVVYIIKVGDGGDSSNTDQEPSKEGKDSGIFESDGNVIYHCKGGGRGGFGRRVSTYDWPATSGGSGGGAGRGSYYTDTSINYTGAPSVKYNIDGIGNDGRGWSGTQGGGGGGGELTFSSYLDYFYYDTYFNNDVNWFQTNTHTSTGYTRYTQNINNLTSNTVTVDTITSYSVELFGYFKANRTGPFTFYLKSDDPAYLWIGENAKTGYTIDNTLINNGTALVDNILEQNNSIDLVIHHYYPFRLQFGKNTGNNIMELHFKLPTDTDTTRRYDNNGYIYRFIPEGRIGGNPYLSYIIKPTDEYKNYITNTDYYYYSYTSYALGGHGGYQYNQSFHNSLQTGTGNGGGGARAHRNNTTITAGQKGFSGIVIIDRNI